MKFEVEITVKYKVELDSSNYPCDGVENICKQETEWLTDDPSLIVDILGDTEFTVEVTKVDV